MLDAALEFGLTAAEESCLEALHEMTGAPPVNIATSQSGDYVLLLRIAYMKSLRPDWTQVEVNTELAKGEENMFPDTGELGFDPELIAELVHPTEARDIKADVDKMEAKAQLRTVKVSERVHDVTLTFKRVAPKAFPKPKAKPGKLGKWVAPKTTTHREALEYILARAAPKDFVQHSVDPIAGRFRIVVPKLAWHRSVAWTRRGWSQTVAEVLFLGWQQYHKMTGLAAPEDLDTLPDHFVVDA